MRSSYLHLVRALLVSACAGLALPAAAQEPKAVEGPSERFVRVIQHLAWSRMPAKLEGDVDIPELDKSDPQKFLLPTEDAQRVIVIADRSATAELCDMGDIALANFIALMNAERASNRWTREQLHMIKWIYIAVVGVRTESHEVTEIDPETQAKAEPASPAPPASAPEARKREFPCPPDLKVKVRSDVERYVTAVNDHLGLQPPDVDNPQATP